MSITVHRALFGQDSAHGPGYELLGTTHPDKALVRRMFNSADLTENAPPQLSWQPALRGLPWEDFYLLMRTFPDLAPGVRGGRVYSHMLLVPLAQVEQLPDLKDLMVALPADAPKQLDSAALVLHPTPAPAQLLTPRLGFLLRELVQPTRSGPLVWAGQVGFDEAAALAWQVLGPAERPNLRLNLGFLPAYLRDPADPLTLVAVPDPLLQRWRNGFTIIEVNAAHTTLGEAEAWLAGLPQQAPTLSKLLQELDPVPTAPSDIEALQRVSPTATALATASLQEVLALATLLHHYPATRPAYRQQVLARLRQLTLAASPAELTRLGSVQDTMLPERDLRQLGEAVQKRLEQLASQVTSAEWLPLLVDWHGQARRSWWQASGRAALADIFAAGGTVTANLVFELWQQPTAVAADYLKLLPPASHGEELLLRELPIKLSPAAWHNGLKLARTHRWLRLHMRCLLALHPLPEALAQQLAVDTAPTHLAALQLAAAQTAAPKFVAAAVTLAETRLTTLAGNLCAKNPRLLGKLVVEQPGWQAVWLAAAQASRQLWAGITDPARQVAHLLDLVREHKPVAEPLLHLIGQSEHTDLRAYPGRPALWAALPAAVRPLFLQATAAGILRYEHPEDSSSPLEAELVEQFARPAFIARVLTYPALPAGRAVRYLTRFAASQSALLAYLATYQGQPSASEAQELGQLIGRSRWKQAAQAVFNRSRTESSFAAVLPYCLDQLDWLDRLQARTQLIGGASASTRRRASDDWWEGLWQEASNLYPSGPAHDQLWEAIGRKNRELSSLRSGGEQWRQALDQLRRERSFKQVDRLLRLMLQQHIWNNSLRYLAQNPLYE